MTYKLKLFLAHLRLYFYNSFVARIPFNGIRMFFVRRYMLVGKNSFVSMNVKLLNIKPKKSQVQIGKNSIINPGVLLDGREGRVIIGNNVDIGANTTIDRGALSDTIIGDNTKINNLCHIAHNTKIGKNVIITGCVNISGSSIIEDNVWIAPNASIRGWVIIGESATIGIGSVVTKDIPKGETWIGNPSHKYDKK